MSDQSISNNVRMNDFMKNLTQMKCMPHIVSKKKTF